MNDSNDSENQVKKDSMTSGGTKKPKPIKAKIKYLEERITEQRNDPKKIFTEKSLGNELRDKAMAVILKSAGTKEWNAYLSLFGFTDEELERLMPNYSDGEKNEALAYLIGGGVCGATSVDMAGASTACGLFGRVEDAIENL